jgi:IS30 family transposase
MEEQRITYKQLRPEERMVIASMKLQGASMRAIARMLARPPSTVSRELGRNTCPEVGYTSETAMVLHAARRTAAKPAAKLDMGGVTWGVVLTLLSWKWSPQQIAATLKRVYPDQPEHHVSHETIYTAIYAQPRGELRRQLIACLRRPAVPCRSAPPGTFAATLREIGATPGPDARKRFRQNGI